MELAKGAALVAGESERIESAIEALEKDPHAARELLVRVKIHVHNEYPKMLYKGAAQLDAADNAGAEQSITVNGPEEEEAAIAKGFRLSPDESKSE